MTVDISKIKAGDEVTLRLMVTTVNPNGTWVALPHWHGSEAVNISDEDNVSAVVEHHPKAPSVGDRVKHLLKGDEGSVVSVEGSFVWVKFGPGYDGRSGANTYDTCLASNLERIA